MSQIQITLEPEIQRRARQRARDLGLSLAEYVRRILERDLDRQKAGTSPIPVFDLGSSRLSDVATNKDCMLARAFAFRRKHRGK